MIHIIYEVHVLFVVYYFFIFISSNRIPVVISDFLLQLHKNCTIFRKNFVWTDTYLVTPFFHLPFLPLFLLSFLPFYILSFFVCQVKEVIFNAPKLSDFGVNIGGDAHYFEDTMSERVCRCKTCTLRKTRQLFLHVFILFVANCCRFGANFGDTCVVVVQSRLPRHTGLRASTRLT